MYVCVCLAVTDREVEAAIENGAITREDVTRACRAGGDCGACHGMIRTMIEDHVEAQCPATAAEPSQPQLISETSLVRARVREASTRAA